MSRLDKKKILLRTTSTAPDTMWPRSGFRPLLNSINVTPGPQADGWNLINSPSTLRSETLCPAFNWPMWDANRIAINPSWATRTHPSSIPPYWRLSAPMLEMPPLEALAAAIREDIQVEAERKYRGGHEAVRSGLSNGSDRITDIRELKMNEAKNPNPLFMPRTYLTTESNKTESWAGFLRPGMTRRPRPGAHLSRPGE